MDIEAVQQYKIRWTKENCPYPIPKPKSYAVVHPIINSWDDFTEEDKKILLKVKKIIQKEIGECKIALFGSRMKGYWRDESDYDIMINKSVDDKTRKKLVEYNYDVLINICFYDNETYLLQKKVEI